VGMEMYQWGQQQHDGEGDGDCSNNDAMATVMTQQQRNDGNETDKMRWQL